MKILKTGITCLFLSCLWLLSCAQPSQPYIDSVESILHTLTQPKKRAQALSNLGWHYHRLNCIEEAESYGNEALQYSKKHQHNKGIADAFNVLALSAFNRNANLESMALFDSAYRYFELVNDTSGIVAVLNNQGRVLQITGRCEKAVAGFLKGTQLVEARKRYKKLLALQLNYASALMYCYQYQTAIEVGKNTLPLAKKLNNREYEAYLYHVIGYSEMALGNFDDALLVLNKGLKILKELDQYVNYSNILSDLGYTYLGMKMPEKALEYFLEAKKIQDKEEFDVNRQLNTISIGITYFHLGNDKEALKNIHESLPFAEKNQEVVALEEAYDVLAKIYRRQNRQSEAYKYLEMSKVIDDSLRDLKLQGRLQELNTKYETEKIERELTEVQLEMNQKENRFYTILWLTIGGSLTVLLGYLIVILVLKRKHAEAEKRHIELEYSVLRAQMNPHFIFNALNSIQGFFAENNFQQGNEYLGAFGMLIRKVLDQSDQSLISLEEELETLDLYLQLEQARLKKTLTYEIVVQDDIPTAMIEIPPLILQPFVENAIWHGIVPKKSPGHVKIVVKIPQNEEHLICEIIDDGLGLSNELNVKQHHSHESKGIRITQERLGAKGRIHLQNHRNTAGNVSGVKAVIEIPIEND